MDIKRTVTTNESIITFMKDLAKELKQDTITSRDVKRKGGLSCSTIWRKFGSFSQAVIAADMKPSRIRIRDQDVMIKELGSLMLQMGGEPQHKEIDDNLTYTAKHYQLEFGKMQKAFDIAQEYIESNQDIQKIKIDIPKKSTRRKYGKLINFRGMQHAPVNELGVVFLFGMLANEMDFRVESVQAGFPDCDAKLKLKDGTFEKVAIEFEFKSSNFKAHGHDVDGCDLIVCWIDDWEDCPLPVVELSDVISEEVGL